MFRNPNYDVFSGIIITVSHKNILFWSTKIKKTGFTAEIKITTKSLTKNVYSCLKELNGCSLITTPSTTGLKGIAAYSSLSLLIIVGFAL